MSGAESTKETRHGVSLTNLDQALFDGAGATKRDLVDYLDAVSEFIVPALERRPLSVIRAHRGERPFMQKNLPKHAPDWIESVTMWAESSKRDVTYAVCDDVRTLVWFANQRALEYHPTLTRLDREGPTHLVLDLDPPEGKPFSVVTSAAKLVREVLTSVGLDGALKTSGAKGLHIFVPLVEGVDPTAAAAVTRAIAERTAAADPRLATTAFMKDDRGGRVFIDSTRSHGATVAAPYSPRVRAGVPVSFPVAWDDIDNVVPAEITIQDAMDRLEGRDLWTVLMPTAQELPNELVDEGDSIPVGRVAAMHEGRRRARGR